MKREEKEKADRCAPAVILHDCLTSHPLSDLVHVLGEDVMHVLQVSSHEVLLRFSRAFLLLTTRQIKRKQIRRENGLLLGTDNKEAV